MKRKKSFHKMTKKNFFYRFIRAKNICSAFKENICQDRENIFSFDKIFSQMFTLERLTFFATNSVARVILYDARSYFICQRNPHQGSLIRTLKYCCFELFGLKRVCL